MTGVQAAKAESDNRKVKEEAAKRTWIERHVRESPPLSDDQLRSLGEILGLQLIRRKSARQA